MPASTGGELRRTTASSLLIGRRTRTPGTAGTQAGGWFKPFTRGGMGLVAKRSARRSAPSDPWMATSRKASLRDKTTTPPRRPVLVGEHRTSTRSRPETAALSRLLSTPRATDRSTVTTSPKRTGTPSSPHPTTPSEVRAHPCFIIAKARTEHPVRGAPVKMTVRPPRSTQDPFIAVSPFARSHWPVAHVPSWPRTWLRLFWSGPDTMTASAETSVEPSSGRSSLTEWDSRRKPGIGPRTGADPSRNSTGRTIDEVGSATTRHQRFAVVKEPNAFAYIR